jgi:hypothetical protein
MAFSSEPGEMAHKRTNRRCRPPRALLSATRSAPAQEQCHDAHPRRGIAALVPRVFVGACPAALVWADRHHEYPHGEYRRLASLAYADLALHVEPGCPPGLRAEIETHAARIQNQRGAFFRTDAWGMPWSCAPDPKSEAMICWRANLGALSRGASAANPGNSPPSG